MCAYKWSEQTNRFEKELEIRGISLTDLRKVPTHKHYHVFDSNSFNVYVGEISTLVGLESRHLTMLSIITATQYSSLWEDELEYYDYDEHREFLTLRDEDSSFWTIRYVCV